MKFLLLVYNDTARLDALSSDEFGVRMRGCLAHADELHGQGQLLESQMLEDGHTARSVRRRNGKLTTVDGPFAETKEVLGGFNLIEAADLDEACRIAAEFPWVDTGCIEVRPIRDIDSMRRRVGAPAAAGAGGARRA